MPPESRRPATAEPLSSDAVSFDAVSFDGDDTLWDFAAAFAPAIAHAADLLGAELGAPVEVDWLQRIREEVAAGLPGATLPELRLAAFAEAVRRRAGRPELADRAFEAFMAARARSTRLFPEVAEVVAALAARMPLALTTNGNAELSWTGLDPYFSAVVRAVDCGRSKPDPAIYLITAERLGVAPARILHVGDHPVEDVAGALAAGFQARLIDRTGRTPGALTSLAGLLLSR
ncbi:HAD family hydrolase [Kitasatospora sp. DSM 101779]|uniref:HAD family hydrolase n=1 Tax=Kitasatospora sp. DSM 101779 TaxID=2853165 RepID=UPI0021D9C3E2|nr:HAD family hydrolase [Kitasatospora sp. DSM 101779]MCU7822466.1 HAD family hydrolase [Kitasatospora sp. DSM 101779]